MDYRLRYSKDERGFTLVELIIVIALFALFAVVSTSIFRTFSSHDSLELAAQGLVEAMRHAQSNAEDVKNDSTWGVAIQANQLIVFKGTSYAARDTSADQMLAFPSGVRASGLAEIVFAKVSGMPSAAGTTTLTSTQASSSKNIIVNAKGTITY